MGTGGGVLMYKCAQSRLIDVPQARIYRFAHYGYRCHGSLLYSLFADQVSRQFWNPWF